MSSRRVLFGSSGVLAAALVALLAPHGYDVLAAADGDMEPWKRKPHKGPNLSEEAQQSRELTRAKNKEMAAHNDVVEMKRQAKLRRKAERRNG